ncbi:unnamed protein product [Rhizoctonia solani]|uniref:DUF6535 domain-containing protein n=1 Tax=Rhizoctonia solani TaxID=456999 RepID=A0A8H2WK43_9AGAM|nr:unnamed protein product [Rhizoctonia solani]
MSLMLPDYLSGGSKKPRLSNHNALPPELGVGYPPPDPRPYNIQEYAMQKPKGADPIMEPDEYGAELGKEARVWRIYVRESDRSDAELVDRWNKSLDVILGGIVLGHFNCVGKALFLIESSRRLQEDPANVTAQTLRIISQTLSSMVNGTQPDHCRRQHPVVSVTKSQCGDVASGNARKRLVLLVHGRSNWTCIQPDIAPATKVDHDRDMEDARAYSGATIANSPFSLVICGWAVHLCNRAEYQCRDTGDLRDWSSALFLRVVESDGKRYQVLPVHYGYIKIPQVGLGKPVAHPTADTLVLS